jgi:hypothetical protein
MVIMFGRRVFKSVEPQFGFARLRIRTMTLETVCRQDGANLLPEADRLAGHRRQNGDPGTAEPEGRIDKTEPPHVKLLRSTQIATM